jgi:hypothetical protein
MRAWVVFVVALALCYVSLSSAVALEAADEVLSSPPPRVSSRQEDRLDSALADRASLLFRAMDKDHDKHIGAEDVKSSLQELSHHMPGVHETEFMAFLDMADKDGDQKLSYDELLNGLADGLDEGDALQAAAESQSQEEEQHNSKNDDAGAGLGLLETGAEVHTHRRRRQQHRQEQEAEEQDQQQEQDQEQEQMSSSERRRGQGRRTEMRFAQRIFQQVKGMLKRELGSLKQQQKHQQKQTVKARSHRRGRHLRSQVKGGDDGCVMCQFILERCESNVKQSGVLASMASAEGFGAYLELDTQITKHEGPHTQDLSTPVSDASAISFLETGSQQIFNDMTAATIIGSARQSTRVQRQLERQKYNEIYRIADLSLDDVCEQGMPNSFYSHCKAIYKKQSDVVDGLRYQYRPADICVRIGMCKGKYITKGIHSRYKGK